MTELEIKDRRIAELEAIIEAAGKQEAVAKIERDWNIRFVGRESIYSLAKKHCLYIGDKLFANPDYASAERIRELEAENARLKDAPHSVIELSKMILADCGHSSEYSRLLERVSCRIWKHLESELSALRKDAEHKPLEVAGPEDQAIYDAIAGNYNKDAAMGEK